MIGYATIYTMAPVFSLVLDTDVNEDLALIYPELYKELTKVGASEFLLRVRSATTWIPHVSTNLSLFRVEHSLTRRSFNG